MAATNDYLRFFPYDDPYENQREAMDRIYTSLLRGQDVLFEGACGTGKTLSALVPALEYGREHDKTVVITTSVHQQMRQFIEEARAITRTEPIRAVVFKGKGDMCHVDVGYEECQVLRDTTYQLVDANEDLASLKRRERQLLDRMQDGDDEAADARAAVTEALDDLEETVSDLEDAATCRYYQRNLTADTDGFYAWLHEDVRRPEAVYEYADEHGFCGYELLKDGMDGVDLVVCNYNHVLDPNIRSRFFSWLGRDPEDVIVVFDEAHNIEENAREHASASLTEITLTASLRELAGLEDARSDHAANVLSAFRDGLRRVYEDALGTNGRVDGHPVDEEYVDVTIANEDRRDELTLAFLDAYTGRGIHEDLDAAVELGQELRARYDEAYRTGVASTRQECETKTAAEFVSHWLDEANEPGMYPVASVKRRVDTGDITGRVEQFACFPRSVTGELFDTVYASVLMSATLRPFSVLADVLGLDHPVEMAYGLEFPEANRRTLAVNSPPLFASERDDPETQAVVAGVLCDIIRMTPGNTLAFFPSYAEARRYHDRLDGDVASACLLDEPGEDAEQTRQTFVESGNATVFSSLWATLAEGVSFDGDDAITVVVVGVPYPHLDDRMQAVQDAYAEAFDDGWRYAVEIPTIRKTRQALGRILRSPEEIGVRVLLDGRYTATRRRDLGKYSVNETFPSDERAELVDVDPEKVKFAMVNFFTEHDAYKGNPPMP